jgi:hypothetical protein
MIFTEQASIRSKSKSAALSLSEVSFLLVFMSSFRRDHASHLSMSQAEEMAEGEISYDLRTSKPPQSCGRL